TDWALPIRVERHEVAESSDHLVAIGDEVVDARAEGRVAGSHAVVEALHARGADKGLGRVGSVDHRVWSEHRLSDAGAAASESLEVLSNQLHVGFSHALPPEGAATGHAPSISSDGERSA